MVKSSARPFWRQPTFLAIAAAVLYCTWPIGYLLNPAVAHDGLASELEAIGQPYNWLFIGADLLAGVLLVMVAFGLRRYLHGKRHWLSKVGLIAMAFFGILTMIDALLPMECVPALSRCPSYDHDNLLFAHGVVSISAGVFLFIALFVSWWQWRQNDLLRLIVVGYLLFGIFSLYSSLHGGRDNWAQHYYLTLCSLWIAIFPFSFIRENRTLRVGRRRPSKKQTRKNQATGPRT